jgi:hypothetical protein
MVSCIFLPSIMGESVGIVQEVDQGFVDLSDDTLSCFDLLIARRRCLPVYRGDYWACWNTMSRWPC